MARRDLYDVLGVPRDADAPRIKRAYRELAMKFHPDQNPGDAAAEASFKEVSAAYTVLSDVDLRDKYDRRGFAGVDGQGPDLGSFTELFEGVFGDLFGRKKERERGRDLRYTVELTFEEAALGVARDINFPSRGSCSECSGTGARGGEAGRHLCSTCKGKGEIKVQQGFFGVSKRCATCGGGGHVIVERCVTCDGDGTITVERVFTVTIPAGAIDGSTRRLSGEGEPGKNGAPAGDLNVVVKLRPHLLFKREGEVITCDVAVSLSTAIVGGSVAIPTLEGQGEMKVPAGTQPGSVFRLRGKGAKTQSGARGDLHVRVQVEVPRQLDDAQRQLVRELERSLRAAQTPETARYGERLEEVRIRRAEKK